MRIQTARRLGLASFALISGMAQAQAQDPAKKLQEIQQRVEQEQRDWYDFYKAAKSEEEREALMAERPGREFIAEFKALAEEAKGTDVAAEAWIRVFQLGGQFGEPESAKLATERLVSEHIGSEKLEQFVAGIGYGGSELRETAESALRKIIASSPHRKVQAGATYSLANLLLGDEPPDSAKKTEARTLFEKLRDSYGDLEFHGTSYQKLAESSLFELDHLQIGMVAPDFQAVDQERAAFALSDYRGKVVLVDFWGFW